MKFNLPGLTSVIFYIMIGIKPSFADTIQCGTLKLEDETLLQCQTARLIYTPNEKYTERVWVIEKSGQSHRIYNYMNSNESKYFEFKDGDNFILSISSIDSTDMGDYLVYCGEYYTNRLKLDSIQDSTGCKERCGFLSVNKKYIEEGDSVMFHFSVSPGRDVIFEKKVGSRFIKVDYTTAETSKTVYTLDIVTTKYGDRGEYRVNCSDIVSNSVYLNIEYRQPSEPKFSGVVNKIYCSAPGCILATVNKSVSLECFVEGGSKPLYLKMLKNGEEIKNADTTEENKNTIIFSYVRYNFIPTRSDIDATLKCTVENPALSEPLVTSIQLYVEVTPERIDVDINEIIEGQQEKVVCIASNVRPPLKSDLYINNTKEIDTTKRSYKSADNLYTVSTMATQTFTRSQNQAKVSCCSTIGDGICGESRIKVLFPPKTITVEEIDKQNKESGETMITLKFSVSESNPRSTVELSGIKFVQRKLKEKKIEPENKTFGWTFTAIWSFNFTRNDNMREIKCEVKNDRFPDLELNNVYKLNITYYPIVTMSESIEQKTVYLGEDVDLTCFVNSNPLSTISWHNQTDLIEETFNAKTLDLRLTNITTQHSQTYRCKAWNGIGGIVSRNITLVVKDPSERPVTEAIRPSADSNIGSVAGPIIGCIVVILIAIILFLVIRKRRQDAPPDRRKIHEFKIEERKPSLHPTGNEPIYNNTVSGNEAAATAAVVGIGTADQPEYACVIKKKERGKFQDNNEGAEKDEGRETSDRGDNLVYADLDLAEYPDLETKKPLVTMYEQTEYVSIDFSKTGTVAAIGSDEN